MVTRQREAPLQVILPGFILERREDGPLFAVLTRLALDPKRRHRGRATGLDHFEMVTDTQGPLLDDPHYDRSPACDPEGAFNTEYEREVLILRGHDLILPSLVPDR